VALPQRILCWYRRWSGHRHRLQIHFCVSRHLSSNSRYRVAGISDGLGYRRIKCLIYRFESSIGNLKLVRHLRFKLDYSSLLKFVRKNKMFLKLCLLNNNTRLTILFMGSAYTNEGRRYPWWVMEITMKGADFFPCYNRSQVVWWALIREES